MKNLKSIDQLVPLLPRYSYSMRKRQMEPITLILIGSKKMLVQEFGKAGWILSEKISVQSTLRSAWATVADKSYRSGPMWPSFINGKQNSLGLEMPTKSDTYRRRHHLRLWKTGLKIYGLPVWVGTLSYDRGAGFIHHSFMPTHHISPNLQLEEEYLVRTMDLLKPLYIRLSGPERGHINTGDPYVWNGKALVLNLGVAT